MARRRPRKAAIADFEETWGRALPETVRRIRAPRLSSRGRYGVGAGIAIMIGLLIGIAGGNALLAPLPGIADTPQKHAEAAAPPPATPLPSFQSEARIALRPGKPVAIPATPVLPAILPAWQRFAVPTGEDARDGRPMIAIVIDDVGVNRPASINAIDRLPASVTLSFLPYAANLAPLVEKARHQGHELMVHVPMEPEGNQNPGPHAILTSLPADEIRRRLVWNLERVPGYVGINNHMGSRFTADATGMAVVMDELRRRGLLFMDSRTTAETVGMAMATQFGVPGLERDVFLDNEIDADAIATQLKTLEKIALEQGSAVAIGHPYAPTVRVLEAWVADAEARGFAVVPLSAVAARRIAEPLLTATGG